MCLQGIFGQLSCHIFAITSRSVVDNFSCSCLSCLVIVMLRKAGDLISYSCDCFVIAILRKAEDVISFCDCLLACWEQIFFLNHIVSVDVFSHFLLILLFLDIVFLLLHGLSRVIECLLEFFVFEGVNLLLEFSCFKFSLFSSLLLCWQKLTNLLIILKELLFIMFLLSLHRFFLLLNELLFLKWECNLLLLNELFLNILHLFFDSLIWRLICFLELFQLSLESIVHNFLSLLENHGLVKFLLEFLLFFVSLLLQFIRLFFGLIQLLLQQGHVLFLCFHLLLGLGLFTLKFGKFLERIIFSFLLILHLFIQIVKASLLLVNGLILWLDCLVLLSQLLLNSGDWGFRLFDLFLDLIFLLFLADQLLVQLIVLSFVTGNVFHQVSFFLFQLNNVLLDLLVLGKWGIQLLFHILDLFLHIFKLARLFVHVSLACFKGLT